MNMTTKRTTSRVTRKRRRSDEDDEWEDGANEIGIVNEVDELGPTAREIERRRGNLWE